MNLRYVPPVLGVTIAIALGLTWSWARKAWQLNDSSAMTWVVVVVILAAMVGVTHWCQTILDPSALRQEARMSDELDNAALRMEAIERSGRSLESKYPVVLRFSGGLGELRKTSEALKGEGWSVIHSESTASSLALQRHQKLDSHTILAMTESALAQEREGGILYLGFDVIFA